MLSKVYNIQYIDDHKLFEYNLHGLVNIIGNIWQVIK